MHPWWPCYDDVVDQLKVKFALQVTTRIFFIFDGTFTFQSVVQLFLSPVESENEGRTSSQASFLSFVSTSIRYADLTEKAPFFSCVQALKSSTTRVHK
jgi:hypothetical protein